MLQNIPNLCSVGLFMLSNVQFCPDRVDEIPESVADCAENIVSFRTFCRDENFKASWVALYVDFARHHDGLSVDVHDAFCGPFDF